MVLTAGKGGLVVPCYTQKCSLPSSLAGLFGQAGLNEVHGRYKASVLSTVLSMLLLAYGKGFEVLSMPGCYRVPGQGAVPEESQFVLGKAGAGIKVCCPS